MRKNIILITFLSFTTFLCLAQKDSTSQKRIFGVRAGLVPFFSNDELNYLANISIEKGKNFVAFGPILGNPEKMNYNYLKIPRGITPYDNISLNGLNFVYQRNPNPKGKRFDFYFQYLFNYFHYIDKGIDDVIVLNSTIYFVNLSYSSRKSAFGSTIGYGFKCKIFEKFYLYQDLGFGVGYSSFSISHEDPKYSTSQRYFDSIIGLNLGLEYRFDKKKK